MDDSTDRDFAIAVALAESSEELSDDDFKPSLRKVGLKQQLAFNACRIPKTKLSKRNPNKKKDVKGNSLVEDLRSADEGPQRKVRKQAIKSEVIPMIGSVSDHSAKGSTSRSISEFDSFRYTGGRLGGAHAICQGIPVEDNQLKPLEISPAKLTSPTEVPNTYQPGPDNDCQSDPVAYQAKCLVIDIDTDEVLELCDDTQFSVLLRLCDEEREQDECRADVPCVDRVPALADGTLVNAVSQHDEPTTSVTEVGGLPRREALDGPESYEPNNVSTNKSSNPKRIAESAFAESAGVDDAHLPVIQEEAGVQQLSSKDRFCEDDSSSMMTQKRISQSEEVNALRRVSASPLKNIAPSAGVDDADLPVTQEEAGVEQLSSQYQFCEDVISSMMTQKRISQSEEVNALRRVSTSPLKNISNLPARVQTNKEGVKPITQAANKKAANKTDLEDTNGEGDLSKEKTDQLRGPQVLQAIGSSEKLCQDIEHIKDSPIIEQLSASGNAMEYSIVTEGDVTVVEDALFYRDKVREIIWCPVCGDNINAITVEERFAHTNSCLDRPNTLQEGCPKEEGHNNGPSFVHASDEVKDWLEKLNLSRYLSLFVQQEIDWDTLPWLTEEDLAVMGVTAIGPRRKMFLAIQELNRGSSGSRTEPQRVPAAPSSAFVNAYTNQIPPRAADGISKIAEVNGAESNNLITNYFPLPPESGRRQLQETSHTNMVQRTGIVKNKLSNRPRSSVYQNSNGIPAWMSIPGTPFRVDAFQHLSGDCSYWFLTHFHTDHYQGLTRGFRYGHIFCSSITARLVHLRIGVSWEKLMIIPLHEKVKIAGVNVTFIDANHCPGAVMILFEPPNGEAVLHTGDFRFCTEMANNTLLQTTKIHTLVLDTTYCDPQYDFPAQDTVIRFVIEAIQAEMFNPDTLFLIGSYTIGKERIFLEVGKVLKKFVYVGAPRKKLLECMDLSADDTKWLTGNEHDSFIHVVPLWSISSFKRMSSIARHYQNRYKLIVAFSPTGWSFGRGKKKTPGKRWKQGTMIRYEVPYSEHCSFPELREFLRFIAPEDIIPSVLGKSGVGADAMIASLWSEDQ